MTYDTQGIRVHAYELSLSVLNMNSIHDSPISVLSGDLKDNCTEYGLKK